MISEKKIAYLIEILDSNLFFSCLFKFHGIEFDARLVCTKYADQFANKFHCLTK